MPDSLPRSLKSLRFGSTGMSGTLANLPPDLKILNISPATQMTLPANLPPGLQRLDVSFTAVQGEALLSLMQAHSAITELGYMKLSIILSRRSRSNTNWRSTGDMPNA